MRTVDLSYVGSTRASARRAAVHPAGAAMVLGLLYKVALFTIICICINTSFKQELRPRTRAMDRDSLLTVLLCRTAVQVDSHSYNIYLYHALSIDWRTDWGEFSPLDAPSHHRLIQPMISSIVYRVSRLSLMQNQAPGYFHLHHLRSLYWKILPFLHRLIHLMHLRSLYIK